MTKCLLCLMSPTHVISSICAVKTLHDVSEVEATVIIHWPSSSKELTQDIASTVKNLVAGFPFIKNVITVSYDDLSEIVLSVSKQDISINLKQKIRTSQFEEIYYAHDVVGQMYQLLCLTYPDAKRICFGDAFGIVFEKEVHLGFLQQQAPQQIKVIQRFKQKIKVLKPSSKKQLTQEKQTSLQNQNYGSLEFPPHEAVLILPVDQSGAFLRRIPFRVCGKPIFLETIQECIDAAHELTSYSNRLLDIYESRTKLLVLTENLAEGNFIEYDKEVDMWCSIIMQNCESGSVVFLKSHPGETLDRNDRIKAKLNGFVDVIELDEKFKRFPIEIWKNLVCHSKIICMSYPVLSLKYLYAIDVIQPMDDGFIENWFPDWTWASYKNALSLYMEPLRRLSSWDGKSVLWSGNQNDI